ncbi:DUF5710 domain-containing protein [Roseateles sp. GG27B]
MPNTYLTTHYKDRAQVKALGARWDGESKRWYVPDGFDLSPFSAWLVTGGLTAGPSTAVVALVDQMQTPAGMALTQERGLSLSVLLMGVADLVSQAYRAGVWTQVEVLKADLRSGHVYLELGERNLLATPLPSLRNDLGQHRSRNRACIRARDRRGAGCRHQAAGARQADDSPGLRHESGHRRH